MGCNISSEHLLTPTTPTVRTRKTRNTGANRSLSSSKKPGLLSPNASNDDNRTNAVYPTLTTVEETLETGETSESSTIAANSVDMATNPSNSNSSHSGHSSSPSIVSSGDSRETTQTMEFPSALSAHITEEASRIDEIIGELNEMAGTSISIIANNDTAADTVDTVETEGDTHNTHNTHNAHNAHNAMKSRNSVIMRQLLPDLSSWLHKRSPHNVLKWQKRRLIMTNTHLLWREKKVGKRDNQRFVLIENIERVITYEDNVDKTIQSKLFLLDNTNPEYCFVVCAKINNKVNNKQKNKNNGMRIKEYLWKCESIEERNKWVDGINKYIECYNRQIYD